MGKIRIKTLGSADEEKKEKEKANARKEVKKSLLAGRQAVKVPGLKGGERLVAMGPTEEELAATPLPEEKAPVSPKPKTQPSPKKRGKRYQKTAKLVEKSRHYSLTEAMILVKKTSLSSFDGSVEVHINTAEKGLSGSVKLPHGTGKQTRVAIANPSASSGQAPSAGSRQGDGQAGQVEALLKKIESGMIDFDVLVATPAAMPLLAKFARILGPRGLMPNPKAGTITEEPEKVAEKFKAGEIRFKTEAQAPLIHLTIGRVSFPQNYLEENLKTLVSAIGPSKIQKLTISSTMGPGIKVDLTTV